jgi:hypothetical protein
MLPLGGLHEKRAVQCEIWVPTQHLLWDQEKPWKTLIELASCSQQSGIKYASPNISPYLCCCFFFSFFPYKLIFSIIFMCI